MYSYRNPRYHRMFAAKPAIHFLNLRKSEAIIIHSSESDGQMMISIFSIWSDINWGQHFENWLSIIDSTSIYGIWITEVYRRSFKNFCWRERNSTSFRHVRMSIVHLYSNICNELFSPNILVLTLKSVARIEIHCTRSCHSHIFISSNARSVNFIDILVVDAASIRTFDRYQCSCEVNKSNEPSLLSNSLSWQPSTYIHCLELIEIDGHLNISFCTDNDDIERLDFISNILRFV